MRRNLLYDIIFLRRTTGSRGILATLMSFVLLAFGVFVGGILLFFALIFALGLLVAFCIWRVFFLKKTRAKFESFMRRQASGFANGRQASGTQFGTERDRDDGSFSGAQSRSGKSSASDQPSTIDGDFEVLSGKENRDS